MPYPNEHAARMMDPKEMMSSSMRSKMLAPGIRAIMGKKEMDGPMMMQAIRFDKDKFTPEQAKKWMRDHGYKMMNFEAASEPS